MKFALIFFLACFSIFSENHITTLIEGQDSFDLGKQIEYLIDKENRITLENITEPEIQKLFIILH